MAKIYLSILTECDAKSLEKKEKDLKNTLSKHGYKVISPLDIDMGKHADASDCLCYRLRTMMDCDVVFMCEDWQYSEVCEAEKAVAEIYGKRIKYEIKDMPEIMYWHNM